MTERVIVIHRSVVFQRGALRPFRDLYSLRYEGWQGPARLLPDGRLFAPDYEGTPLPGLRRTAAQIAREHSAIVRDESKRTRGAQ